MNYFDCVGCKLHRFVVHLFCYTLKRSIPT